ncbi:uncharacterized protein LOC134459073 isoform X2 [Engraulis encrasicolus]|uniref:uncharacterized protein LOC134459073 isoform X2 n=1 Tax=Engraulis encrasicolus TaxID=184585 RepID=UPI002FD0744F
MNSSTKDSENPSEPEPGPSRPSDGSTQQDSPSFLQGHIQNLSDNEWAVLSRILDPSMTRAQFAELCQSLLMPILAATSSSTCHVEVTHRTTEEACRADEQLHSARDGTENSEQVKTSGSPSLDADGRLHQAVPDFTAAPSALGAGTSPSPEPRWLRLKSFLAKTRRIHFNFKIPTRRHRKVDPGPAPSNMDLGQNVDTSAIHSAPACSPQKPCKRPFFMLASCFRGSE